MRVCVNVKTDAEPRLIEEDIEIALRKIAEVESIEWEVDEQDRGCFTADNADVRGVTTRFKARLRRQIQDDTDAVVAVEVFEGWPPPGWSL